MQDDHRQPANRGASSQRANGLQEPRRPLATHSTLDPYSYRHHCSLVEQKGAYDPSSPSRQHTFVSIHNLSLCSLSLPIQLLEHNLGDFDIASS
jgi:hypothetical protein